MAADRAGGGPPPAGCELDAGSEDAAAFRRLVEHHLDPVWRFARRRCTSDADADDVAADAFAVAWRRRADLPVDDEVRLWLFGVARRVLANQRRGSQRRARLQDRLATTTPSLTAPAADALVEGRGELVEALDRLDPADRDLIVMQVWDGLAVLEIAALLGCTPNAASIRLHRARRRLADLASKGAPPSRTSPERSAARQEDAP